MNISSQISFVHESNFSHYFINGTEVNDFEFSLVMYIFSILMSFPINFYVIWLIVTGTGNGLAADFFLLNFSVCGIILSLESILLLILFNYIFQIPWIVVTFLDGLFITCHSMFESLICVERYLAVVHPVIFLKFKPLRYRLMCSSVVWVLSFASGGLSTVAMLFVTDWYLISYLALSFFFFSVQLYCCVAVLRALKQSGPGEREREREREEENSMKKRAFYFILVTTLTAVILYVAYFILFFFLTTDNVVATKLCTGIGQFCSVSAGLVQPVLFLYRVGKLNFIKCQ